jgi:putative ABC transport system permease protein
MVRTLRLRRRRELRRHRAQFAAVIVTLFLGVALYGATSDAYRNLTASYQALYSDLRFADLTVSGGPIEELARRAAAEGATAATRTVADVPVRVDGSKLLGRIVGMPASAQPAVDRVQVLSGSYLRPSDEHGVLVEQHMASHFQLAVGDDVRILGDEGWVQVEVIGTVASPEYLWPARSRQEVVVPPDDFGVLFVPEGLARAIAPASAGNEVTVYGAGSRLVAELSRLARDGGALDVVTRTEQPSNAALQEDVSGFGELALLFPTLFLAAGAMAAFVLLSRLVRSQRAEIGMLTANGFDRRTIFRCYLGYGVWAGLLGGVAGAVGGVALGAWITHLYTAAIAVPITVIRLTWATPLIGIAIAVLAGAVAAAAPARAAASITPAEAMRGTMPGTASRAGLIERAFPFVRRLPGRWKLAVRNVGRSRRRTVSTLVGVVLSLVLVLVSWGMLDTTDILLSRQFDTVQRQDAQLYPSSGSVTASDLSAFEAVPGVAAAEPAVEMDVSISSGGRSYGTTLVGLPADTTMHTFLLSGGDTGHLGDEGLLVGQSLAGLIGVSTGDVVTVESAALASPIRLPIAGFVDEPLGTFVYASLSELDRAAGAGVAANTALLRFAPDADAPKVLSELRAIPTVSVVVDSRGLAKSAKSLLALFSVFVGVMLLFGASMSFALMFNTMSANVAERASEMATLRATGVSRATISGLLTRENLLVTAIGIPLGLSIGYLLADGFMSSFSSDLFSFELHVRGTTLALAAAAMLGVALVSQWPGIRAVGRLDVARVVRERSV